MSLILNATNRSHALSNQSGSAVAGKQICTRKPLQAWVSARAHALMRGYDLDAKAIPDLAIDSVCIHGGHRSGQNTGRHRVRSGRLRLRRRTGRAGPACLRHACCSSSKLGHCGGLGHADGAGSGRWW